MKRQRNAVYALLQRIGSDRVRRVKSPASVRIAARHALVALPHTEVEFEVSGDHARIRKARRTEGSGVRGQKALRALRGSADTRMSTDEIMALTRGSRRAGANGK